MKAKADGIREVERPKVNQIVPLALDGKEYSLTYDFGALIRVEQALRVNLLQPLLRFENVSATTFLGLLAASLAIHHPKLTVDQVGELIAYDKLSVITDALVEVYVKPRVEAALAKAALADSAA